MKKKKQNQKTLPMHPERPKNKQVHKRKVWENGIRTSETEVPRHMNDRSNKVHCEIRRGIAGQMGWVGQRARHPQGTTP